MKFVPNHSSDKKSSIYVDLTLWISLVFIIVAIIANYLLVAAILFVPFILFLLKKMRMSTNVKSIDQELCRDAPIFWFELKSELKKETHKDK